MIFVQIKRSLWSQMSWLWISALPFTSRGPLTLVWVASCYGDNDKWVIPPLAWSKCRSFRDIDKCMLCGKLWGLPIWWMGLGHPQCSRWFWTWMHWYLHAAEGPCSVRHFFPLCSWPGGNGDLQKQLVQCRMLGRRPGPSWKWNLTITRNEMGLSLPSSAFPV